MSDSLEKGILIANWLRDDAFVISRPLAKITKNLSDAAILSRIVWWFTPKADGGTKLRVCREGIYWLVKAHEDWESECCIPGATARDSIGRLKKQGFIEVEYHRFGGLRKIHIHLCWDAIAKALAEFFPDPGPREDVDTATTESITARPRNDGIHHSATTESVDAATTESIVALTGTNSSGTNDQVQIPPTPKGECSVTEATEQVQPTKMAESKEEKPRKQKAEPDYDKWREVFMANKPESWAGVGVMNAPRQKHVKWAIAGCQGNEAEALKKFEDALTWINQSKNKRVGFWQSNHSMETLLRRDSLHFMTLAENAKMEGLTGSAGDRPAAEIRRSIGLELRRLGLTGALNWNWQRKTGKKLVSELDGDAAIAYLAELESMNSADEFAS